jgi:hypothetical protein
MPNRIPTPGVSTPAVRTSKSAQPAAKPLPSNDNAKARAAEKMLKQDMAAGKVKNLDAERTKIFKATGGYANGYTN